MALCLADSLIVNRGYSGSDVRRRYWSWQAEGLNNCFRKDTERSRRESFGLGYNIALSLLCLLPDTEPTPTFQSHSEDSGNGSLMRLAPIPIFYCHADISEVFRNSALSSLATHPGSLASESCQFLAYLVARAIHDADKYNDIKQFLDDATEAYIVNARGKDVFGKERNENALARILELLSSSPSSR